MYIAVEHNLICSTAPKTKPKYTEEEIIKLLDFLIDKSLKEYDVQQKSWLHIPEFVELGKDLGVV